MKTFVEKPEQDCVVTFGVSGWSSYFFASLPPDYPAEKLYKTADRMIPDHIRRTHPANDKLKWIKIFRFESKITFDTTPEETQESQEEESGKG